MRLCNIKETKIKETMNTSTIEYKGKAFDMGAVRNLMDEELCEQIHGTVDTDQEFFDAYVKVHAEKFGEAFAIN
jgi:hypothetical protein